MKRTAFYLVNILLPLLIGATVYILFRPDTYFSGFVYHLLRFKIGVLTVPKTLEYVFRNYLPDMTWAYALTFSVSWVLYSCKLRYITTVSVCFCMLFEFSQLFGWLSGTFDYWDITLEICMTALCALIIKSHEAKEKRK